MANLPPDVRSELEKAEEEIEGAVENAQHYDYQYVHVYFKTPDEIPGEMPVYANYADTQEPPEMPGFEHARTINADDGFEGFDT